MPALLDLYAQLHPTDPRLSAPAAERILEAFTAYPGSAIFLGWTETGLASTCALVVIPNLTRGGLPYGLIENVVTAADHRKRGYGAQILRAAIASAWSQGCYKVMLLTGSEKPETLKFYEGVGFERSKTGFQLRRPAGI